MPISNESSANVPSFVDSTEKSVDFEKSLVLFPNELDDENDLNGCQMWGNNWRQFTSVLPGIVLLLTIGLHQVFTVYELDYFTIDKPGHIRATFSDRSAFDPVDITFSSEFRSSYYARLYIYVPNADAGNYSTTQSTIKNPKSTAVVMTWYLGAIVGSLLGASLLRTMKKRSIYVSFQPM